MNRIAIIAGFILCFTLAACGYDYKADGLYAEIDTSMGKMIFTLHYDKAPITVGNFVGLAEGTREMPNGEGKEPFYDGLIFHRIIKGFVIQGGCPQGTGTGGPGYRFIDEFDRTLIHDSAGILSMANAGPNTNGSQFFITLAQTRHLNGRHSIFGKIVHGEDVMKDIENVETDSQNRPKENVVIESIKVVRVGEKAKYFDAENAFAKNEEMGKRLEENQKLQKEEEEKNLEKLLKMLQVNKKKIVTSDSGLRYYVNKRGKGSKPQPGDTIAAHYNGWLANGKKFDSSYDRRKPFETPIGVRRVIPGWDEAFLDMRKGEKRILIIPYQLAYGERGRPPMIPAKATLVFAVELLSIKKK